MTSFPHSRSRARVSTRHSDDMGQKWIAREKEIEARIKKMESEQPHLTLLYLRRALEDLRRMLSKWGVRPRTKRKVVRK